MQQGSAARMGHDGLDAGPQAQPPVHPRPGIKIQCSGFEAQDRGDSRNQILMFMYHVLYTIYHILCTICTILYTTYYIPYSDPQLYVIILHMWSSGALRMASKLKVRSCKTESCFQNTKITPTGLIVEAQTYGYYNQYRCRFLL